MASEAEARIRAKAERLLRDLYPDARIIHEFELGGVRMDLGAVTEDRLILLEIKSELDTLSRLERQAKFAEKFGGPVFVCLHPRWQEAARKLGLPWRVETLIETDDGFDGLRPMAISEHRDRWNYRYLLYLLLKPELLRLCGGLGVKSRMTVPDLQNLALEGLTGRTIRRGVMAALRARRFGWVCDDPVEIAA